MCWYTLHIYPLLPVEFQSVIVLAHSQTCIHVQKSLSIHLFVPSPAGFFFFFPRAAFYVIGQFSFFFSSLLLHQFFVLLPFLGGLFVCLLFDTKSKRNQKFLKYLAPPEGICYGYKRRFEDDDRDFDRLSFVTSIVDDCLR